MDSREFQKNGNLPLFVYGTLRSDRRFGEEVRALDPVITIGRCHGNLHWNLYVDRDANEAVTVALDPTGKQRVRGELFYFRQSDVDAVYARFDELEFNFSNLHVSGRLLERDRVYLRTGIKCVNHHGRIVDAYAYIYYARHIPVSCLPLVRDDLSIDADTEYPESPLSVDVFRALYRESVRRYVIPSL